MTREEAIKIFKGFKFLPREMKAVDMAIKALEQETCENCSIKYELEVNLKKWADAYRRGLEAGCNEQEPCEDAVSRQAVDQNIYDYAESNGLSYANLKNAILDVPSVTPTRKKGKWIYTPHERLVDESDEGPIYEVQLKCSCSVCNADFGYRKVDDNYCKYCGADMRGIEDGSK